MLLETLAALAMTSSGAMSAQERGAPRGDYRDSCSGEYVNRGRLYADCRTRRNDIRETSIELNRCSNYEIRNDDGFLTCGPNRGTDEGRPGGGNGGGWNPGGPGGGWNGGRQSITVYRDANYRGQAMQFNGEVANLRNTGMNDTISSFQLRGAWELCTDANFGGRCTVFDVDAQNLAQWRLNDSISSMRPARRGGGRY